MLLVFDEEAVAPCIDVEFDAGYGTGTEVWVVSLNSLVLVEV
jgi:hypothetical protein